jgi:endonuclease/exonuclease/phosphatase (EEP) superfamily protein YafD
MGFSWRRRELSVGLLVLWLAFLATFADSPASLLRGFLAAPQEEGSFRVVTLNCASHVEAAFEAAAQDADVILLQESPSRARLSAMSQQVFGPGNHLCWDFDASILSWGEVAPVAVPAEFKANFVHARVQLEGDTIDVICLRLQPSTFRFDLWSPRCWQAFQQNRRQRRAQLAKIADYLQTIPDDRAVVLGGDFNAPPGDAVFRLLRSRLTDAFTIAGRGWGASFSRELPVLRIDQLWISTQLQALGVLVRRTENSDHRMVIADFALDNAAP